MNQNRIPIIRKYILENRNQYVFFVLAASIEGKFVCLPSKLGENVGTLEVFMDAKLLIHDGQHRKEAIIEAPKEDGTLFGERISVEKSKEASFFQGGRINVR